MWWKLIATSDGTTCCCLAISSISLSCGFADPSQKQACVVILSLGLLYRMLTPNHRLQFLLEIFLLHVFHVVIRLSLGDKQANKMATEL